MHIFSAKTNHIFAIVSAIAIHIGAVVVAVLPSSPTVINQQTIRVSFVAPSSQFQQSENHSHKKFSPDFDAKNALNQKEKNEQKELTESDTKKSSLDRKTSGRVDPNATATKAAESDPIFEAAYLNNPAPSYPAVARNKGIQGKVLLDVAVKTDGTPAKVEIARSSGSSLLDEAALDAVRDWKFIPARRAGSVIQANVIVPVEFKII